MSKPNVTGANIASFLGRSDDAVFVDQCDMVASLVRSMGSGYTRGRGFEEDDVVPDDIWAALLSRGARMAVNPLSYQTENVDSTGSSDRAAGDWNRGEMRILKRYRVTYV